MSQYSTTDEVPTVLQEIFNHIDKNENKYITLLEEAISIPSESNKSDRNLFEMAYWMATTLRYIGVTVELYESDNETKKMGKDFKNPPVLFGEIGKDSAKKTVLFCGHYDVQNAEKKDGWDTEPFTLVRKGDKLYGRGLVDNKGPCIAWRCAVDAYNLMNNGKLPVNIKFLIEGLEESGSSSLEDMFDEKEGSFFKDIDYVCICDSMWLTSDVPCLTYAFRGILYFSINIECCNTDQLSGTHGGTFIEAMPDLVYLLDSLTNEKGEILVPNLYDDISKLTLEEEHAYKAINFNIDTYQKQLGCYHLMRKTKNGVLDSRWRRPSLTIHGVEGSFSGPGEKTVIPKAVSGKFSIRLVPNQNATKISKLVADYLDEMWRQRGSLNKYQLQQGVLINPWLTSYTDYNYKAATNAIKYVYKVVPDMIREGCSYVSVHRVAALTKASVLLLPLAPCDSASHSQNENTTIKHFINGIKVIAGYFYELGKNVVASEDVKETNKETNKGTSRETNKAVSGTGTKKNITNTF